MRNPFRRQAVEVRAVDSVPWSVGAGLSGGPVSADRAMRLGAVFAAGRLLASSVSQLPLQQYQQKSDGARQQVPLASLFTTPSVVGTRHDWVFRAMTSLVYRGNAVGLITARDYYGYPTSVEWLHPDCVQVFDRQLYGPGSFLDPRWFVNGHEVSAETLVHIPWFPIAGRVWGLDPMAAYASSVAAGLGAQQYAADWFDKGGVPPGTFRNEMATVTPDEAEAVKRRLTASIRTHEPIVYGKDWTYTPIAITPNQAQFVETMRLTASQIAAIYGIPPTMIGGETGDSLTYSTVEMNSINFVQFTLMPWLTKLEDAFSVLLPGRQTVKFNVDALIRTDIATRYSVYQIGLQMGLLNQDECRAKEDLPPLPGGQGQKYATPSTVLAAPVAPAGNTGGAGPLRVVNGGPGG